MADIFSLSYNVDIARPLQAQLVAFLKNAKFVDDWHAPYDGLVLVKTSWMANEINPVFVEFFGQKIHVMISSITPGEMSGNLNPESWEWIRKNGAGSLDVGLEEK